MTNEQFVRTRDLARQMAGIALQERHRDLLDRKYNRGKVPGHEEYDALLDAAEAGHQGAVREMIGLLTTSFTGFAG